MPSVGVIRFSLVIRMPLVAFTDVSLAFGHVPLLDRVKLQVEAGERVCLVGRNGTGKSTLLRIVSGEQTPDAGSVWTAPGLSIARLDQDVALSAARTVFDVVADGLGDIRDRKSTRLNSSHQIISYA